MQTSSPQLTTSTNQQAASSQPPLPLPTVFTPPASCLKDMYIYSGGGVYEVLGPPSTSDCLPSGWTLSSYFSPGFCPSGYVTACFSPTGSIETTATCCPSGYGCQNGPLWWQISLYACGSPFGSPGSYTFTVEASGSSTLTTIYFYSPLGVNAYGVVVRWQSTDVLILTHEATSSISSKSTNALNSAPSLNPTASTSKSLSTGAKAGISLAAVIVFLAVLVGIILVFRRHQRRNAIGQAHTRSESPQHYVKPELDASERPKLSPLHSPEDPSRSAVVELDGQDRNRSISSRPDSGAMNETPSTFSNPQHPNSSRVISDSVSEPLMASALGTAKDSPSFPSTTIPQEAPTETSSATRIQRKSIPSRASPSTKATGQEQMMTEDDEEGMAALQAELEKVRAEKQRLEALRELSELEERLEQRIQERLKGSKGPEEE